MSLGKFLRLGGAHHSLADVSGGFAHHRRWFSAVARHGQRASQWPQLQQRQAAAAGAGWAQPAARRLGWCGWTSSQALRLFGLSSGSILLVVGGDSYFEWTRPQQNAAAASTWLALAGLAARFVLPYDKLVAAQLGIVVAYGTVTEYVFSEWLDVYTYRLGTLPMFIPPYHGLLFLAELSAATAVMRATAGARAWLRAPICAAVFGAFGGVAAGGSGLLRGPSAAGAQDPPDNMGLFWYTNMLAFFAVSGRWAQSGAVLTSRQMAWTCALPIVTAFEHFGAALGTWRWREAGLNQVAALEPLDFTARNPPSGVAGGYAWFNAVAIVCAPLCLRFPLAGAAFWAAAVSAAFANAQRVERVKLPEHSRQGLEAYHRDTNRVLPRACPAKHAATDA